MSANADSVTVIVVNHGGGLHVLRCLACLADQTLPPARILVIDNASTDGSAAACERAIAADVRLDGLAEVWRFATNLGFAAACNRGIHAADTPLVALLNPDAFPEPEWLERLVAWRQGHGRSIRSDDLGDREIFSACAAAVLYRRDAVTAVGGFDEDFFCYCEDVDLGFRLRLAGHHARYVPDAVVHHVGGASSRSDGCLAAALGHRNLVWTLVKNMPGPLLAASLPAHFLQTILAAVVLARRGHAAAFVRAKLDAVRGFPNVWRKRRQVQASRVASVAAIWRAIDKGLVRIR